MFCWAFLQRIEWRLKLEAKAGVVGRVLENLVNALANKKSNVCPSGEKSKPVLTRNNYPIREWRQGCRGQKKGCSKA